MAEAIRILALDHFSGQDRDALIAEGGDAFAWRVIPYWRLRNAANRFFPPGVQHGLAPFAQPELALERGRFAAWTRAEVRRLYREWPFDVFVLPSDAFYYTRALPEACHALGLPLAVTQKETTITDYSLEQHAPDVERHAPFVSDVMTVCSDRHKRFWSAAGCDPSRVVVTGQPRFDVYAVPPPLLKWESLGLSPHPRTILFLSFETDAYLLDAADRTIGWLDLRSEIEEALAKAAADGARVLVKLHPLQNEVAEAANLRARFGSALELVSSAADTRHLILLSDAVVGFQTTALYEAMVAGKPVAYTAWGALYERFAPHLIPFDSRPDLVAVLRSGEELRRWLEAPAPPDSEAAAHRRAFVEEMLGPVDGCASRRTLDVLAELHAAWRTRDDGGAERRRLERLATARARVKAVVATCRAAALAGLTVIARALPGRVGTRLERGATFRLEREREQFRTARRTLRERRRSA